MVMNFPIKYANRNLQNINLANVNFNLTVIFVSLFFNDKGEGNVSA